MLSTKDKLETIIKKFPAHKIVLSDFYKAEEKLTKEEIETKKNEFHQTKDNTIQDVKNMFEAASLQIYSSQEYRYCVEVLEKDHQDYLVLKKSLERPNQNQHKAVVSTAKGRLGLSENIEINKMHRIVQKDIIQNESRISDCPSLLLLHGTKLSNVEGILKEGFKPSKKGTFGPGVYLTNCCSVASSHGII